MISQQHLKTIGSRLVQLREAKGLSAVQVARDALGYDNGSHVAVTRLERAVIAVPRIEHLQQLAAFFGVEPEHLLADKVVKSGAVARRRPATRGKHAQAPARELSVERHQAIVDFWRNWQPG